MRSIAKICLAMYPATIDAVSLKLSPATVLVAIGRPVFTSSRRTVIRLAGADSTQPRTRTRRGLGQNMPANRKTAPTMPAPETPLDSAIEASAFALVPPGRMEGERISIVGSRNRNSAASWARRCAAVRPLPPVPWPSSAAGGSAESRVRGWPVLPIADRSSSGACQRSVHRSSSRYPRSSPAAMIQRPATPGAGGRPRQIG